MAKHLLSLQTIAPAAKQPMPLFWHDCAANATTFSSSYKSTIRSGNEITKVREGWDD